MANEELLQKLRRQRLRMGEDPLPVSAQQPDQTREHSRRAELVPLENKGEVKQRARKFLNADSPGPSPSRMPGRINLDGWEQRCREICSSQPSRKEAMQPPDPHDGCHQPTGMSEQELPARPEHCLATIQEEAKPRNLADAGAKETVVSSHAAEASRTASPSPVYAERDATNLEPSPGPWQELSEEALLERDAGVKKAAEAECFCMWDSEDDDRMTQDERASHRSAAEDVEEPLEFSMLDYLAELPEGVAAKLQRCLKTHEELVRRLCQRNELLQAQVRSLRCDGMEARTSPMTPRPLMSPPFSPMSRKSPQAATSGRIVAPCKDVRLAKSGTSKPVDSGFPQRAVLRDEHEVIEANLRARLQRTIKASKERVQAMQRRVEREEQQVKTRFEVAMQTREGMERSIKGALREHSLAKVRIAELEEAISVCAAGCRTKEKEREQLVEKQASLRNELKALRTRASKHHKCERRIQDLQRELEALTKACHSESPRWAL